MARERLDKHQISAYDYRAVYSLDTETTSEANFKVENKVSVFAWIAMQLDEAQTFPYNVGLDIESLYTQLYKLASKSSLVYFHNLKFDLSFIEDYLLRDKGFKEVETITEYDPETTWTVVVEPPMSYDVLRSDMATYRMRITFDGWNYLEIRDSAKLYPTTVDSLGKAVGVKKLTTDFDYDKYRVVGENLTQTEWRYVVHDARIVAKALLSEFSLEDLTNRKVPLTRSKLAFKTLKKLTTNLENIKWSTMFPKTTVEMFEKLSPAFGGGRTFVNPMYAGKIVKDVVSLDVNSTHPNSMTMEMPVGEMHTFDGLISAEDSEKYPIQIFRVSYDSFKMKKGKFATLLPSVGMYGGDVFTSDVMPKDADGNYQPLLLTSVDLKWFRRNYNIENLQVVETYAFESGGNIFKKAAESLYENKRLAKEEFGSNSMQYVVSKLMLNGAYGYLGKSPINYSKHSVVETDDDGNKVITYETVREIADDGESEGYLPTAIFITAYSRDTLYKMIETVGVENWVYSDTDSVKILIKALEKALHLIDDYKLGFWKIEYKALRIKALRPKAYGVDIILDDGSTELEITVAGLNSWAIDGHTVKDAHGNVVKEYNGIQKLEDLQFTNDEDSTISAYDGNLVSKRVVGGTILYRGAKALSRRSVMNEDDYLTV